MTKSSRSTVLYVVALFLSGCAVGAFGHRVYTMSPVQADSPREYRVKYMEEMTARLSLNADQVQRVQAVLDATRQRYREIYARSKPELDIIQGDQTRQINEILSEEQQAKYEVMRKERDEARKREKARQGY